MKDAVPVAQHEVKKREEVLKELKAKQKEEESKNASQYPEHGLQNALHLATTMPHPALISELSSHGIGIDLPDCKGRTPICRLSEQSGFSGQFPTFFTDCLDSFIGMKAKVDVPDRKMRTAYLNFYGNSLIGLSNKLLGLGADVNQMDESGLTALKYAVIRRNVDEIARLHAAGAKINQLDKKRRNLLHYAVNMSSASSDASFEVERLLIDLGIEINARDKANRTPLHYAFVKIGDWENKTAVDPIETVSSLCGIKGLETDKADYWGKTPLHYASQRGASICCLYLLKRGGQLETKDIYGNTPLGIAVSSGHFNFGIIMI